MICMQPFNLVMMLDWKDMSAHCLIVLIVLIGMKCKTLKCNLVDSFKTAVTDYDHCWWRNHKLR